MFGGRLSDSDSGEEGPHFTSTVMVMVMVMIVMATVMMMVVMISMMMVVNLQIEGLYPKHKRTNQDYEKLNIKYFYEQAEGEDVYPR